VTNIGDITSRLSADTTKMSDQISLNLNVLLRSIVEGILYLVLMVNLSWKLALLSFVSIPVMTAISNVYGGYYRKLSKYTQDALADANSIAEEALGAVTTVRDFAADRSESEAYGEELNEFLKLTYKQVYAYSGFALTWTTIPSLVTAITLYYGGK
jgi:ATP-binding cassette subfamily B (MDR/TAP) protein 9